MDVISREVSEAVRHQKLLDGEMGKLDNLRALALTLAPVSEVSVPVPVQVRVRVRAVIDDGDQTRACGQYSLRLIIQPPSCTIFRDASLRRTKIERKHFCKLFNTKWPDSYHEALQHAMRVCLVRLRDSTEHV